MWIDISDKNQNPNLVFLLQITEEEIETIVGTVKGKLSTGFNWVPESLIKKCIKTIKEPLAHVCNASLVSGIFPDTMKLAKVRLNHKKGDA